MRKWEKRERMQGDRESGEFSLDILPVEVFRWGNKTQAGDETSQTSSGWWSCCLTEGN